MALCSRGPFQGGARSHTEEGPSHRPDAGHPGAWPLCTPPGPPVPLTPPLCTGWTSPHSFVDLCPLVWGGVPSRALSVKGRAPRSPRPGAVCAMMALRPQEEPLRSPLLQSSPTSPPESKGLCPGPAWVNVAFWAPPGWHVERREAGLLPGHTSRSQGTRGLEEATGTPRASWAPSPSG